MEYITFKASRPVALLSKSHLQFPIPHGLISCCLTSFIKIHPSANAQNDVARLKMDDTLDDVARGNRLIFSIVSLVSVAKDFEVAR